MSDKCVVCGENPQTADTTVCQVCIDDWHKNEEHWYKSWSQIVEWAANRAREKLLESFQVELQIRQGSPSKRSGRGKGPVLAPGVLRDRRCIR
jgi:hypothetical protein